MKILGRKKRSDPSGLVQNQPVPVLNHGNLKSDGRWDYVWDGENRLTQMTARTAVGPQLRLTFEYDWMGRRIGKKVWTNVNGTGQPTVSRVYVYRGWNLVMEWDAATPSAVTQYVWGRDLAGGVDGAGLPGQSQGSAGGVGGLVGIRTGTTTYGVAYDGNGNVMGLVDGSTGTVAARYEYGPFGEVVRATGPMARINPFRFSTKYQDEETDLVYYGFRFYNASTGRWPSRDPLADPAAARFLSFGRSAAGTSQINSTGNGLSAKASSPSLKGTGRDLLNLYTFAANTPVGAIDFLGLCACDCGPDVTRVVQGSLQEITEAFNSRDGFTQLGACMRLFVPTYAFDSWDMTSVLNIPWTPSSPGCQSCSKKLTYLGGCYDAADINYAMFGHMFMLCNGAFPGAFPARDIGTIVGGGKVARGYPLGCSVAFAKVGNSGGTPNCSPSKDCQPSSKVWKYDPGANNWRWDGLTD